MKTIIGISQLPEMAGRARAFFPTHSFNKIKEYREDIYKILVVSEYLKEKHNKREVTNEKDIKDLRRNWLNGELMEIERINKIPQMTRIDLIEMEKYKDYVVRELDENKNKQPESGNYILKNESVIVKLFEKYGDNFSGETKELWKRRWINGSDTLPPIKTDTFKHGNNKHLLLTILHEAYEFMRVEKKPDYIKKRWGLKSYDSDVSRYLNDPHTKPHPEATKTDNKIKEILKPELF